MSGFWRQSVFSDEGLWDPIFLCTREAMAHRGFAAALTGYRTPLECPCQSGLEEGFALMRSYVLRKRVIPRLVTVLSISGA